MAKSTPKLTEIVTKTHDLLESLDSDQRKKVIHAVFAIFGESNPTSASGKKAAEEPDDTGTDASFGPKAKIWMRQNRIKAEMLDEVFHGSGEAVEVIASDVPGGSAKAKTRNCYLLAGVRSLLASDAPTFSDADASELCKRMSCFDQANNATTRNKMKMSGSKKTGFTLTAPCMRDAATLIKEMAPGE